MRTILIFVASFGAAIWLGSGSSTSRPPPECPSSSDYRQRENNPDISWLRLGGGWVRFGTRRLVRLAPLDPSHPLAALVFPIFSNMRTTRIFVASFGATRLGSFRDAAGFVRAPTTGLEAPVALASGPAVRFGGIPAIDWLCSEAALWLRSAREGLRRPLPCDRDFRRPSSPSESPSTFHRILLQPGSRPTRTLHHLLSLWGSRSFSESVGPVPRKLRTDRQVWSPLADLHRVSARSIAPGDVDRRSGWPGQNERSGRAPDASAEVPGHARSARFAPATPGERRERGGEERRGGSPCVTMESTGGIPGRVPGPLHAGRPSEATVPVSDPSTIDRRAEQEPKSRTRKVARWATVRILEGTCEPRLASASEARRPAPEQEPSRCPDPQRTTTMPR